MSKTKNHVGREAREEIRAAKIRKQLRKEARRQMHIEKAQEAQIVMAEAVAVEARRGLFGRTVDGVKRLFGRGQQVTSEAIGRVVEVSHAARNVVRRYRRLAIIAIGRRYQATVVAVRRYRRETKVAIGRRYQSFRAFIAQKYWVMKSFVVHEYRAAVAFARRRYYATKAFVVYVCKSIAVAFDSLMNETADVAESMQPTLERLVAGPAVRVAGFALAAATLNHSLALCAFGLIAVASPWSAVAATAMVVSFGVALLTKVNQAVARPRLASAMAA